MVQSEIIYDKIKSLKIRVENVAFEKEQRLLFSEERKIVTIK